MGLRGYSDSSRQKVEAAQGAAKKSATGADGSAATKCCTFVIKSETIATQPTNRARTRIGIGEEVKLTTDPSESVTWSIVGDDGKKGKLSTATGTATTYTAHDRAVGVTIEAKCSCHTETIGLTVVQPNHGTLENPTDISALTSTTATATVGFVAVQHFQPNDVSFINCEHKEGTCPGTATGVLSGINGITHEATGDWILFFWERLQPR